MPFETRPVDVDERAIEAGLAATSVPTRSRRAGVRQGAGRLERGAARLVLGADQVASCEGHDLRQAGRPCGSGDPAFAFFRAQA